MASLTSKIGDLTLRNPVLLASGIWGESGASLARAYHAGAGAVVSKSIGSQPREGYPNPTVDVLGDWGMLNAMGLPNPGIDEYPAEIAEARARGAVVVGSVFGGDAEEFARLAVQMEATGVAALELNLSCPHAKGFGSEIGSDPDVLAEVVRATKAAVRLPVWAKLTPNAADPASLARAAEKAGADAISAINTVRGLSLDRVLRRPVLAHGTGGLSGPAIKPIALACVWQIYQAVKIPVVGIGGVSTAEDAFEFILAGARAIQIGTAVSTRGVEVLGRVSEGLGTLLEDHGFDSVDAAVGAAHRGHRSPT